MGSLLVEPEPPHFTVFPKISQRDNAIPKARDTPIKIAFLIRAFGAGTSEFRGPSGLVCRAIGDGAGIRTV